MYTVAGEGHAALYSLSLTPMSGTALVDAIVIFTAPVVPTR